METAALPSTHRILASSSPCAWRPSDAVAVLPAVNVKCYWLTLEATTGGGYAEMATE